jgi:tricorn protease
LLRNKADRPVQMTVNSRPETVNARTVTFQPISSESDLRYLAYVARNRDRVRRLSDGRVGYIHIPNMGPEGIREFIKWYYPQIRKEGMVVDVRYNGGGNVSQMLIERLRRELLATGFARTREVASTYPSTVFHGYLVCVLNQNSASDGDIFPAMFKQAKLGPLIGKRSWGGVVGITNRGPLIDGAAVSVPEFGFASADGHWIIEGHGVEPDIDVENDPRSVIEGHDRQLERAVAEVMKQVHEHPKRLPERPASPVKTP